jgi:hypothetical protein
MFNGGFLNDRMIQVSIYAGIVFYIVAHPETFKMVDGLLGMGGKDKGTLLLVHSAVVSVLLYFGSKMIFDPVMRNIIDGFRSGPSKKVAPKRPAGKKPNPKAARPVKRR